jgi:hypothetical protein
VLALAWQTVVALALPPYAFDALTYHLTTVATWIQHSNLAPTPLSLCCARYPANAELMFAWPMLLTHTDYLVDTVQIGFALLGACSVAGIVSTAKLGNTAAAAAAGLFAVSPIVLTQSPTAYADLIVAGLALAALYGLFQFIVTSKPARLVPAAVATGLLLGTKGTGVLWASILIVGASGSLVVAARRGDVTPRLAARSFGALVVVCLALGTFWYVRNWIDTGNPVYPFRVAPAGVELFNGPVRIHDILTPPPTAPNTSRVVTIARSWATDLDFWRHGPYVYERRLGGLGPLWPWLGLPLLLPLVFVLVRRRDPLLAVLAGIVAVFVLQPYQWWSRFTIALGALAAIAIVFAAVSAPRLWMRRVVRIGSLALAIAGVLLSSYKLDPAARAQSLTALDVLKVARQPARDRTVGRLFFPEYRFLECVPKRGTLVVDLKAPAVRFVYPLFGRQDERRVVPAGDAPLPPRAWVLTAVGRPLDRRLQATPGFKLVSDVSGVRAWRPTP